MPDDGIVRVADFGLAFGAGWIDGSSDHAVAPSLGLDGRLSVAGSFVGTLQYMPLEQILGEEVDARSDQFAFCMSLYEAVWDGFPFDYRSFRSRIRAPASALGRLQDGVASLFGARGGLTIPAGVRRYPFSFRLHRDHPATVTNRRSTAAR